MNNKMNPGARLFGNALASIQTPSQRQKPKSLGLKGIKNPDCTGLKDTLNPAKLREDAVSVSSKSLSNANVLPMDPYAPYYALEVPTYCYVNNSMHQSEFSTPQPSPPSYQGTSHFNSTYSLNSTLSHEEAVQSLYSLTAADLVRQISGPTLTSTPDCPLPFNSRDSGCQLSDDNDLSGTSAIDSEPFISMSYYHMANTPALYSTKKQVLNEVPPIEMEPEPKQAQTTLIRSRVNRKNVQHIQRANTYLSSGEKSNKTLTNLPQSIAKYSSSEDSGADVSTDEDLFTSTSYAECKGCEALSERVSLADRQKQWKALPDYGRTSFLSLKCKPGFVDSHCHLDFLLGRQNYDGTYTEFMQKHRGTYPASYEGCVAVFCHPNTFHKMDMWQKYLGEEGVWGAFGCHPHHSKFYNSDVESHLTHAIQHSKVRALGEIGLDYSNRNDCSFETQHWVFRRQLTIAVRENLPLVIHCRDANEDVMRIMKEIVPRLYTIHLHCFTDGWDWAQKWLNQFPNLCIGITNLVTFPSAVPTHTVVKMIPLDRLLLETDAPYFVPRKVSRATNMRYSHPGMAIHVAAQIAAIRGVSLKEIIHHTRQNTKKIYGI